MSNRVIKDSIWTSKKLASCSYLAQLHYPRLYLLIDDWSCFEIDLEVIRGKVYPKLFEVTLKDIEGTLKEFAQKGLLFTWCIQDKTYGYFTGDEPGRLPAPKRRHKRQTPIPPQEKILSYMKKFSGLKDIEGTLKPLEGTLKPLEGLHTPNLNLNPNLNPTKDIVEIISHLNEKTGKHFSCESKETKGLINGRLAEGRTLADFKRVIDIKVEKWLNDPKMSDYLRPSTLFRPGNFEAYLNELKPEEREKNRDKEFFDMVAKEKAGEDHE